MPRRRTAPYAACCCWAAPRLRASLRVLLLVPVDIPVLPRGHDLACLLARGRREQLAESVLSVGAGHELGVVLNRSVRHHDEARLAVVGDLGQ